MKKIGFAVLASLLALPLAAETWKNVSLMDAGCAAKKDVVAKPDEHPKACALQCAKAGYGAIVNGKFVKFDKKGDELASEAIKNSSKSDHLRATVVGEMKNGTIQVTSLTMD